MDSLYGAWDYERRPVLPPGLRIRCARQCTYFGYVGTKRILLEDAALAAFSVFFTRSPSFLAYQRTLERDTRQNNAHTLFGMQRISTTTAFGTRSIRWHRTTCSYSLRRSSRPWRQPPAWTRGGVALEPRARDPAQPLIALDDTTYHQSRAVHCPGHLDCTPQQRYKRPAHHRHAGR